MSNAAVAAVLTQRQIVEVLHFTTSNGLIGILSNRRLSARSHLPHDKSLEFILDPNCADRSRDSSWLSYVNLSVSRVNGYFLSISNRWHAHKDIYWCILSFDSRIMSHAGVHFATTNNAYPYTQRATGDVGLLALFAATVRQFWNKVISRSPTEVDHFTTCRQAEVLYPDHLSLEHLRIIYVDDWDVYSEVEAQLKFLAPELAGTVKVVMDPSKFQ